MRKIIEKKIGNSIGVELFEIDFLDNIYNFIKNKEIAIEHAQSLYPIVKTYISTHAEITGFELR